MNEILASRLSAEPSLDGLSIFDGFAKHAPYLKDPQLKRSRKICNSLEDAVRSAGLKDGMTISFHHAFREGDKTINQVIDLLARMGYRDLTLASSSLLVCNAPLIEHIKNGVIRRIYSSGVRGKLAAAISDGLMDHPVHIHSHGGRAKLVQDGEIRIDVAFLGVPTADEFGNANGVTGRARCGSLGYAKVDAQHARQVILLTDEIVPYPNAPASISQDQVDFVVKVDEVGDPSKISIGATRVTNNPRELLIARLAADTMIHSGFFKEGVSLQTGSGAAAIAVTRFLEAHMRKNGIKAEFALGGISGGMAELHKQGLIRRVLDVQSFDADATESLRTSLDHIEISANEYSNIGSKGACCDQLDLVILSALEVDVDFNVNVITGSDGVMSGASGGHCDVAAGANLSIVVAPLVRSRIPTVVRRVTNLITPGECVGVLVTDHGIAVNPRRPEIAERLKAARLPLTTIEELQRRAYSISDEPQPIEFLDKVVGIIRYRDGSVIDVVRQLAP